MLLLSVCPIIERSSRNSQNCKSESLKLLEMSYFCRKSVLRFSWQDNCSLMRMKFGPPHNRALSIFGTS